VADLVTGSVQRYLQASRGTRSLLRPQRALTEFYQIAFAGLARELSMVTRRDFKPPDLIVVYSMIAHAETLILDGRTSIVYDQYLGQIFNRLNRLYFENAGHDEVSAYMSKLWATRCLAAGRPRAGLGHAFIYAALAKHLRASGHDSDDQRRAYGMTGEAFVLAHELVHVLYHSDEAAARLLESYCLDLVTALRGSARGSPVSQMTEEAAARLRAATETLGRRQQLLNRTVGAQPSQSRAEAISQFIAYMSDSYTELGQDKPFGQATPEVLEECVCDAVALMITVGWSRRALGDRLRDSFLAAFLALHNLRLMRWIDREVAVKEHQRGYNASAAAESFETQLRFHFFRELAEAWLEAMWQRRDTSSNVDEDETPAAVVADMIFLNDQYSEIIFDYALGNTSRYEDIVAEVARETSYSIETGPLLKPGEDAFDAVRRVCNLP
jgi:hypothetical protein